MSLRGTRRLSQLFQTTMKVIPERRRSGTMEDVVRMFLEKDSVLEPDLSLREQQRIRDYHARLIFKDGKFVDMDLLNAKRRLLCVGKLSRRSDSAFDRRGKIELFVLLFDHYLVLTKLVGKGPNTMFQVYKRPIPLDLLMLETYGDTPTRVRRRSSLFLGRDDAAKLYSPASGARSDAGVRGVLPLTITHEGHGGGSYTLHADTEEAWLMWKLNLEEAIRSRQGTGKAFEMKILNRESFLMKSGVSSGYLPQGRLFTRTINCITPFFARDGRRLMAVGCVEGLWIGDIRDPQSFHCVLPLQMVRQCTVLEGFEIILILTDNDLCAYDLESCVPTSTSQNAYHPPRKLNDKGQVSFFRTGMIDKDTYVIYSRKKRLDMTFRMLKVVRPVEQMPTAASWNTKQPWFEVHRNFILPMHCTDIIFLCRGLVILHRNGFDVFNPTDFQCVDMPLLTERNIGHKNLIKRCTASQSLGLFRLQTEAFLLCYDTFGIYIDKHGTLINDGVAVDWEGVAESVSYQHPYILLFSSGFVEVRHAVSGRLEQIIRGNSMRCLWEGDGYQSGDMDDGQPCQDLNNVGVTITPAGLDELAVQCIFTLLPSKRSSYPTEQ